MNAKHSTICFSCSNSSSFGAPRNLPLIAMQRPTIDSELLYVDMDDSKLSRSSLGENYKFIKYLFDYMF